MSKGREINYFKIGSFVLFGLVLLVGGIIIFASGKFFQKTVTMETYFNETVQGLSVGSPVKYRGLQIGYISKIEFLNQMYPDATANQEKVDSRYVYVEMAITSDLFTEASLQKISAFLNTDIQQGLRAKLALQGLTGNAYLEMDFVDPKTNPPLHISWAPKNLYVPSTPSTLTQFGENLSNILDKLKQVDLDRVFNNFQDLMGSTKNTMDRMSGLLEKNDQKMSSIVSNLQNVTERAKLYPSSILFGRAPEHLNPSEL